MAPRPDVVEELVQAALNGMEFTCEGSTGDEILSACFTLTRRAMRAAINRSPHAAFEIQKILGMLLLDCVSDTPNAKDVQ